MLGNNLWSSAKEATTLIYCTVSSAKKQTNKQKKTGNNLKCIYLNHYFILKLPFNRILYLVDCSVLERVLPRFGLYLLILCKSSTFLTSCDQIANSNMMFCSCRLLIKFISSQDILIYFWFWMFRCGVHICVCVCVCPHDCMHTRTCACMLMEVRGNFMFVLQELSTLQFEISSPTMMWGS